MTWFSLSNSCLQFLFLAQQIFLIGHETTSYYVLQSGRQLLPVPMKIFFWNILVFLWNGKYSIKLGKKGLKIYNSYKKSILFSSQGSQSLITTDEFLDEEFREKTVLIQSSCCSNHNHNDNHNHNHHNHTRSSSSSCSNDIEIGEFKSSLNLITNDRMER